MAGEFESTGHPCQFRLFLNSLGSVIGSFVLLETPDRISLVVVFGNTGLDWIPKRKYFGDQRYRGEILDSHLLTEVDARARATELGLNLEDAKMLLKSNYKKAYGADAEVVESVPSIEERLARIRNLRVPNR